MSIRKIYTGQKFRHMDGRTIKVTGKSPRGGYLVEVDGVRAGAMNRTSLLEGIGSGRYVYAGYEAPVKMAFVVMGCAQ